MSGVEYLANMNGEPLKVALSGIPAPVVNVTTNSTHTDRQIALMAAVQFHQDLGSNEEEVAGTAMCFAYFLETGEYPSP